MADEVEDDDLRVQRAASYALKEIGREIEHVSNLTENHVPTSGRSLTLLNRHLRKINKLLNILQEDPQLMDPSLKAWVLPLTNAFIELLVSNPDSDSIVSSHLSALYSLSESLYSFCKVRGPKVITRFLNNEARYIQPLLNALDNVAEYRQHEAAETKDEANSHNQAITAELAGGFWQTRYVLQLWIGHLMLTPFDLATIASGDASEVPVYGLQLPLGLSFIADRVVRVAFRYLSAPTKEQITAAKTLVVLALRPDMRRLSVLDSLLSHILKELLPNRISKLSVHAANGYLLFLNGLLRSADLDDLSAYLEAIFPRIIAMMQANDPAYRALSDSATTKTLLIKIVRNLVIHLLQLSPRNDRSTHQVVERMLNIHGSVEEVVDVLLSSLSDRETPVRYAASKSLGMVASKLDPDLAAQVVEAVLESLDEDVRIVRSGCGIQTDVSSVSAARWHGLTLSLAHMLFRKTPLPEQLSKVLDALYSSLTFEQRSSTGHSLGVNVRDAANFGLWSLARRYSTDQVAVVDKMLPSGSNKMTTLQQAASQLSVAACLDPAGNVRRGSSAALQELIGRHPYIIPEGITVVQVVDYQAVGLRRRAMMDVAFAAAKLDRLYLARLLEGLYGWRGIQAPDVLSRNIAAASFGKLNNLQSAAEIQSQIDRVMNLLMTLPRTEVEQRHGLIKSLAAVFRQESSKERKSENVVETIRSYWSLFDEVLAVRPKDLQRASLRPELTTTATLELVSAISELASKMAVESDNQIQVLSMKPGLSVLDTVTACLRTSDPPTLEIVPQACIGISRLLERYQLEMLFESWVSGLNQNPGTRRRSGFMTALAALTYSAKTVRSNGILSSDAKTGENETGDDKIRDDKIFHILRDVYFTQEDIDAKVVALRSIALAICGPTVKPPEVHQLSRLRELSSNLSELILTSLNDYTINERGDVGSLVRVEAMITLRRIATPAIVKSWVPCWLAVWRLSLERLDKVRMEAAHTLQSLNDLTLSNQNTSSFEYFHDTIINMLKIATIDQNPERAVSIQSFLDGICSSTGQGSESVMQTARSALWTVLDQLPTYPDSSSSTSIYEICNGISSLLSDSISTSNDRVLMPLLETISFLFDVGIFDKLTQDQNQDQDQDQGVEPRTQSSKSKSRSTFKFLTFLSLIQKSHFKSTSIPKLHACIHIYRGIISLPTSTEPNDLDPNLEKTNLDKMNLEKTNLSKTKIETLRKLISMLLHPFPKVRVASAEALFVICTSPVYTSNKMDIDIDLLVDTLKSGMWSASIPTADRQRKKAVEMLKNGLMII